MPDTARFQWSRIPNEVCFELADAAEPGDHSTAAEARKWLRSAVGEPSIEFLEEGEPGATVAHVLRDNLDRLDESALAQAYAKARSVGLVPAPGRGQPSTRTMRQRVGALRMSPRLRALLLEVLIDVGRPWTTDDGERRLDGFMHLPVAGPLAGGELMDYQAEVVRALERRWARDDHRTRGFVVMPTGSGKTRTAVDWLLAGPLAAGSKVLWVAGSVYLLEQAALTFVDRAPLANRTTPLGLGLIAQGYSPGKAIAAADHDIVLSTVASLHPRGTLGNVRSWLKRNDVVVVFDEAHHAVAPTWLKLATMATHETNDAIIGLTATPVRMSGSQTAALAHLFGADGDEMREAIIAEVSIDELVERRVLADPIFHTISTGVSVDATGVDVKQAGDFSPRILKQLADAAPRNQSIVRTYLSGPEGNGETFGRTIVYAVNVAHAEALAKLFRAEGVPCEAVSNRRSQKQNREAIAQFRSGEIQVLTNVQLLTEGIDVPGADSVFLARPTMSQTLFSQMVGRALRGPRMGGTERAHIVDFQDLLGRFAAWRVTFSSLGLQTEDEAPAPNRTPRPVRPYDVEALVTLALAIGDARPLPIADAFRRIPVGYYVFGVDAERDSGEETTRTVLVFDHDLDGYERIRQAVEQGEMADLRRGSWERFFADLRTPRPTEEMLSDLREFVLQTGAMPDLVRLEERNAMNPRRVAEAIIDRGGRDFDALTSGSTEAYQSWASVIDRVWGGRDRFAHDVREEWARILEGRPVPIEERRFNLALVPGRGMWSWGKGSLDLDEIVAEQLADPELFPRALPRPPAAVRWSLSPMRDWASYDYDDEAVTINVVLNTDDPRAGGTVPFLVFHELLHHEQKVLLGMPRDVPESVAHGAAFYDREHTFPEFAEYDGFLDTFHRRFRDEPGS